MTNKVCNSCLENKAETDFWAGKNRCINCLKKAAKFYRMNNPIAEKSRKLLYYYGIDISIYNKKLEEQAGCCKICNKHYEEVGTLVVDHDHDCSNNHPTQKACDLCLRDLLCQDCNRGIGLFEENVVFLNNAILYIELHKERK
jgi:hypothetical protein